MPADPADIARYTTDGILVYSPADPTDADALRALCPNAVSRIDQEIEMFFDSATDAQAMLDEAYAILSSVHPISVQVELAEDLGLGKAIALTPAVPVFTVVDSRIGLSAAARVRSYAYEMNTDRYALELLGQS
jgi:tetrahydromethanopterin S-methyltransferase subunit B